MRIRVGQARWLVVSASAVIGAVVLLVLFPLWARSPGRQDETDFAESIDEEFVDWHDAKYGTVPADLGRLREYAREMDAPLVER